MNAGARRKKKEKRLLVIVKEYRSRLIELLSDERIVYSLLSDPNMRYKLLYVAGALKIPLPLVPSVARGVSAVSYTASQAAP